MGSGIYKITNLVNNKVYIGSSVNIHERILDHKRLLRINRHDNIYLQSSYNKYGIHNFKYEVLELCRIDELVERENYYIDKYKSIDSQFGYNLVWVSFDRRNVLLDHTKIKISRTSLIKNQNFKTFKLINISSGIGIEFDNLVEAANYLINNNYTNAPAVNVRRKLSNCLRGKIVNNGHAGGSIRKTIYKHKWEIIN